eukprot:6787177-Prymnesium_polylepis.1
MMRVCRTYDLDPKVRRLPLAAQELDTQRQASDATPAAVQQRAATLNSLLRTSPPPSGITLTPALCWLPSLVTPPCA